MELNHLLLFTAVASSILLLVRAVRFPHAVPWRAGVAVLVGSVLAWFAVPRYAGFIAAAVWSAFLLFPAILRNRPAARHIGGRAIRFTPAVTTLIAINIVMFFLEVFRGGSMNPTVLHELGELDPIAVLSLHEYWRLVAALFLHYGALHLALNLLGLYLLGLPLELQLGTARFLACYLLAGICSSSAVVVLTRLGVLAPMELVGASGAVMGIVGAWGGFLVHQRFDPIARQRLRSVAIIIVLQIAFDVTTPRVSLSAHLAGLLTGVVLGIIIGWRMPARVASPR